MKTILAALLIGTIANGLSACTDHGDVAARNEADAGTSDTVGDGVDVGTSRFASGPDFRLPFTTRIPADMTADTVDTGEGWVVRIRAAFDGEPMNAAALHVGVLPDATNTPDARAWARALAAGVARGGRQAVPDPDWADTRYDLTGERLGMVAVDRHAGRWFYVLVAYPPALSDRMAPRVDLILDRWRWRDDGRPLRAP